MPGETSTILPFDPNKTTMDDGKTQTLAWFGVKANNSTGESDCVTARGIVVGPCISLPFKESMSNGQLDNGFASLLGNEQYNSRKTAAAWRVVTDAASDNDGDMLINDNETETKAVSVIQSPYGRINDLKAEMGGEHKVVLTWGQPILPEPIRIYDGFENYSPFAKNMSPWTMIDGDKGLTGALQPSSTYPGQGEPFAFTAFNPNWWIEDMTNVNPGLAPHNGNQYAAAVYALNENQKLVEQNNWLISPRLSGRKQEITFYVMNVATRPGDTKYAESFDVLYSTESIDTASFVKIKSEQADGTIAFNEGANWKRITIEVPEGAKYFAIHHNTPKGKAYIFGIDDISYEQVATGADDDITEYIIYRDGKRIASVKGSQHTYTNNRVTGEHIYNVTAIYTAKNGETNESGFSNDASINTTSIETIENEPQTFDVTTLNGVKVRTNTKNYNNLQRGVYIINGKKRVVK